MENSPRHRATAPDTTTKALDGSSAKIHLGEIRMIKIYTAMSAIPQQASRTHKAAVEKPTTVEEVAGSDLKETPTRDFMSTGGATA